MSVTTGTTGPGFFPSLSGGSIGGNVVLTGTATISTLSAGTLVVTNLPTDSAGLATNQVYANGKSLSIV